MINYNSQDKELIESSDRYKYYDFTEEIIKQIISKNINEVVNDEWRILIQMIYPKNMIGSGFFQPILIFDILKNGKRKDPPIEAYNGIADLKQDLIKVDCLLFRIMDYIKENSDLEFENSWYRAKEKILEEGEKK